MGVFPQLPSPNDPSSPTISPMYMIFYGTCGPHRPLDPWVVSSFIKYDQLSEHNLPPIVEEIASSIVLSVPPDAGQKLHPIMEYDQVLLLKWGTLFRVPLDSLDDKPL